MPQLKVVPKIHTEQMYGGILQMFSYKDKKSAIELYYKCGRRVAPLINELGYPDRHTSVQLGQRLRDVRRYLRRRPQQGYIHRRAKVHCGGVMPL